MFRGEELASSSNEDADGLDFESCLDELYYQCLNENQHHQYRLSTAKTYCSLLGDDANDLNIMRGMILMKLGMDYFLNEIFEVDVYHKEGHSLRRADAYDGFFWCTKIANSLYARKSDLEDHDFQLTAAFSLSRQFLFQYKRKNDFDIARDPSAEIIAKIVSDIVPTNDAQRYAAAFAHQALRMVYYKRLDFKTMLVHAYKALQLYIDMENITTRMLNDVSELFGSLEEVFADVDAGLQQIFAYGSCILRHREAAGSLNTLAGIVWRYNNDFTAVSEDSHKCLTLLLDLLMKCVRADMFGLELGNDHLREFPINHFRDEMDKDQDKFVELYHSVKNNVINFQRLSNQPHLVFELYVYSGYLEQRVEALEEQVKISRAEHARMFKRDRKKESPVYGEPVLKK